MLVSTIILFERFAHQLIGLCPKKHNITHEKSGVCAYEQYAHVWSRPLSIQSCGQVTDIHNFFTLEPVSSFEKDVDAKQVDNSYVDEAYERSD